MGGAAAGGEGRGLGGAGPRRAARGDPGELWSPRSGTPGVQAAVLARNLRRLLSSGLGPVQPATGAM